MCVCVRRVATETVTGEHQQPQQHVESVQRGQWPVKCDRHRTQEEKEELGMLAVM